MLLLASILGEVKPPVASKEEIDAAGGISIVGKDITLEEERCLVCLSDYECGEEIRTLSGCGHLFHKTCIDQVTPKPVYSEFILPSEWFLRTMLTCSGLRREGMHVRCVAAWESLQ